jgi:hypothetical protein
MAQGKKKYIETPEKLLEYFNEYKKEVKSNPRTKHVFVGKDAVSEREELERPLTLDGFEIYCFEKGYIKDLGDYFSNKNDKYSEFSTICSHIKKVIRKDQIEGGMVGQYNASITQRLNGLKDQSEIELKKEPRVFNID